MSGEAEYEPHHLSFHEDVRRSLIDDWKSMFGMGLMEALAPREPSPEPRQKASTAETAETRIVGKVCSVATSLSAVPCSRDGLDRYYCVGVGRC
jgi:hypothetical protein